MEKRITSGGEHLTIRPYRPEDESGVLSLWEAAFGKDLPVSLWRWKFIETPYSHRIMLCVDGTGRVLSMFSGVGYRANCSGRTVEITQLMDNATRPEHQGGGLFVRTIQAFVEAFTGPGKSVFLYGLPGQHHYKIGEKYHLYRALKGGMLYLSVETGNLSGSEPMAEGSLEKAGQVDDAVDALWRRCRDDYPFAVVRDADFLQWRFLASPHKAYEIWVLRDASGAPAGYAVLCGHGEKTAVVDMLTVRDREIAASFPIHLGKVLADLGVRELETWLPSGHFLTEAFLNAGFVSLEEPFGFVPTGRSFDPSLSFDWISENIYFTMGDGDLL